MTTKMTEQVPEPAVAGTGTKMAIARLNARHADKIAWGEYVAVKIALHKLTVHSREVRDELYERGLCVDGEPEFWLGAVFRNLKDKGILIKTGLTYKYASEKRNIHERTVSLWEINPKADISPYRIEPTLPPPADPQP